MHDLYINRLYDLHIYYKIKGCTEKKCIIFYVIKDNKPLAYFINSLVQYQYLSVELVIILYFKFIY